jgi:hypothetical protein
LHNAAATSFGAVCADREYTLEAMRPIGSVQEALQLIDGHHGGPEDFVLSVQELLLDPLGIHMALITDRILSRGWEPNGYEQCAGYRIYRYKHLE